MDFDGPWYSPDSADDKNEISTEDDVNFTMMMMVMQMEEESPTIKQKDKL